jgi:16S rRNA (guanine966-N2)-methyltransferase
MRIIAGRWRGRRLVAPAGIGTRPTAERLRQATFDILMHAPWGGVEGRLVLDLFAGTGALGLEALSRGAARASFFETDRGALAALRANIASCGAEAAVHPTDAARPPAGPVAGLVFLDPPYGQGLVAAALAGLDAAGRIDRETLLVAEVGSAEPSPPGVILAERRHGAGRVIFFRM